MRPDGYTIQETGGKPIEADTLQCRHCGRHWIVKPGSGAKRGWCLKCSGPLCGRRDCMTECLPFEKRLELYENGEIAVL